VWTKPGPGPMGQPMGYPMGYPVGYGQNLGPGPWASPWATLWATLWAYFFLIKIKKIIINIRKNKLKVNLLLIYQLFIF